MTTQQRAWKTGRACTAGLELSCGMDCQGPHSMLHLQVCCVSVLKTEQQVCSDAGLEEAVQPELVDVHLSESKVWWLHLQLPFTCSSGMLI
jgi:hypothetical protein